MRLLALIIFKEFINNEAEIKNRRKVKMVFLLYDDIRQLCFNCSGITGMIRTCDTYKTIYS
ncbi:Uncharacterised protein [Corynebacterium kutscheri]|uniref:Uncharacterized protein n=1 Tax=Corynebacterium kutscheri TaxID=35755 RepID=A0A0F6TE03_9CORY|nr:hypothetical protein UL82_07515 [Corynebacterium kutscheri]VEH09991.1 Uncharacterised protein [Corynebacterium kutscheri]VEH80070.1 Uncharacterised protein [Corynebacterium kutscheri]